MEAKGFIITVGEHRLKGVPSIAEAMYLVDRYYKKHGKAIHITVNGSPVYKYDPTTKEEIFMGKFTDLVNSQREANGLDPIGTRTFLPFLEGTDKNTGREGPGKEFILRKKMPFWIRSTRIVQSLRDGWSDQIFYEILFKRTPDYIKFQDTIDLEPGYTLTLSADPWRVEQLNNIIKPHFEGNENEFLILVKPKRAYTFADPE